MVRHPLAALALLTLSVALLPTPAPAAELYFIQHGLDPAPEGNVTRFSLHRADPDGAGSEELAHDMRSTPQFGQMAVSEGRVYWRDLNDETHAATSGGTLLGTVVAPAQVEGVMFGRPSDAAGAYRYFFRTSGDGFDEIVRGTRDSGGGGETLVRVPAVGRPGPILLDESAGKIYWAVTSETVGTVQRANLADGSGVETLIEGLPQIDDALDLALDPAGGKLYVADPTRTRILRANLDGTGVETVITGPYPYGIAFDPVTIPEPGAAAFAGVVTALAMRRRSIPHRRSPL